MPSIPYSFNIEWMAFCKVERMSVGISAGQLSVGIVQVV